MATRVSSCLVFQAVQWRRCVHAVQHCPGSPHETALSQIAFCYVKQQTASCKVHTGSGAAGSIARGSYNTLIRSITWFNCLWSLSQVPSLMHHMTWYAIASLLSQVIDGTVSRKKPLLKDHTLLPLREIWCEQSVQLSTHRCPTVCLCLRIYI